MTRRKPQEIAPVESVPLNEHADFRVDQWSKTAMSARTASGGAIGARMAGVDVESHFTLRRMNDWHSAICHVRAYRKPPDSPLPRQKAMIGC